MTSFYPTPVTQRPQLGNINHWNNILATLRNPIQFDFTNFGIIHLP